MFLTHDLSHISDDFRGTYHLNKIYIKYSLTSFNIIPIFPFWLIQLKFITGKKVLKSEQKEKTEWTNIAFMTPYKVQYFLWPWNRCWLNVAFVYSVWHYNRKSKTALNIALNLFWKLTVSANLFTLKICLRLNPIFTEMVYKINKTKCTVDTKSSKIHNSTFI